jgi:hypothetical protein
MEQQPAIENQNRTYEEYKKDYYYLFNNITYDNTELNHFFNKPSHEIKIKFDNKKKSIKQYFKDADSDDFTLGVVDPINWQNITNNQHK